MLKKKAWTTKWGKDVISHYREKKNDWNTNQSILTHDEYYLNELGIRSGEVGVDIGAHIGACSLAMASLGMEVHAVEVLPENIELIKRSLGVNGWGHCVSIHHRAIADVSGNTVHARYGDTERPGNVHEFVGHVPANTPTWGRSVAVETLSLNDLFALGQIEQCRVLKIDCEGGEWPCFEGASWDTLAKIDFVVGELHCGQIVAPREAKSIDSFLGLFHGEFVDVSAEFGFNVEKRQTHNHFGFVFKRRGARN